MRWIANRCLIHGVGKYFPLPPYSFHLIEGEAPALIAFSVVGSVIVLIISALQTAAIKISDNRGNAVILEERVRTAEELRRWHDPSDYSRESRYRYPLGRGGRRIKPAAVLFCT
jgi:hypothetical protein